MDVKGALKQAVHSMPYGSLEHNMRHRLGQEIGGEASRRFLALPVVRLILEQREARYRKLCNELVATDAYGNQLELGSYSNARERRKNAMSILTCQAQSYELPILHPLIEYSRQTAGSSDPFTVTAWLHDGVWAKCSQESANRHIEVASRLVSDASAKLLGSKMVLDVETLQSLAHGGNKKYSVINHTLTT